MADRKVRVGVLGAGAWAVANHIPELARRDDVELVVAVRKGRAQLDLLRERFGFGHVTESHEEALDLGLDAVIVASPPALHFEHASAALSSGAHVLCEKPFTLRPEDAWELDRLASEQDRALLVAFGWNYRPIGLEARRLMETHGVGAVQHVMVSMSSWIRDLLRATGGYLGNPDDFSPEADTWTNPEVSGGGYAAAQLSHALGLALWLTDQRAESVFAMMNTEGGSVELHDAIAMRFESGATGVVSGATSPGIANAVDRPDEPWPRHHLFIRVVGDEGQLTLDLERDFLWLSRADGTDVKADLPSDAGLYLCDVPPNLLVDIASGRGGRNNSPAELGARTVEVVAAAYDSVARNVPVRAR